MTLFMGMLTLLSLHYQVKGQPNFPEDPINSPYIMRDNYGLLFTKQNHILADGYTMYKLVFRIPRPPKYVPADLEQPFQEQCSRMNNPYIQFGCEHFRHLKDAYKNYIIILEDKIAIAEDVTKDILHSPLSIPQGRGYLKRVRKAIFSFVSDLTSSLFGIAKESDLVKMKNHIEKLESNYESLHTFGDKLTADLFHYADTVNKRIELTHEAVSNNKREIVSILTSMQQWKSRFLDLSGRTRNVTELTALLMKFMGHYSSQTLGILEYSNSVMDFADALFSLHQGRLTHHLVPPADIHHGLNKIQNKLSEINNGFRLLHSKNIEFYYAQHLSSFQYTKREIFIQLYVPVSKQISHFNVYHLNVISTPIQTNQPSAIGYTKLDIPKIIFAVTQNGEVYLEISPEEFDECDDRFYVITCPNPKKRFQRPHHTCVSALYFNDHEQIKAQCKFNIYPHDKIPIQAYPLDAGQYLITSPSSNMISNCKNEPPRQQKLCSFCRIRIPCNCEVIINGMVLLNPGVGCEDHNTQIETITPINFPVLTSFGFSPSKLDALITYNQSSQLDIPNIPDYIKKFTDISHHDAKLGLELQRTAQQIKNNSATYYPPPTKNEDEAYYVAFLSNSTFLQVWHALSVILMGILVPAVIYLFCQNRNLAMLTTAAQQLRQIQSTVIITITPPPSTTLTPTISIEALTKPFISYYHVMLFISCLTLMFLLIRFCHFLGITSISNATCMIKIRKFWGPSQHCDNLRVYLKMSNKQNRAIIYATSLDYEPNIIAFTTSPSILTARLKGYRCDPHLEVTWSSPLTLLVNSVPTPIDLPENIPIPIFEKATIKTILNNKKLRRINYTICLKFTNQKYHLEIPQVANDFTNPPIHTALPMEHQPQHPYYYPTSSQISALNVNVPCPSDTMSYRIPGHGQLKQVCNASTLTPPLPLFTPRYTENTGEKQIYFHKRNTSEPSAPIIYPSLEQSLDYNKNKFNNSDPGTNNINLLESSVSYSKTGPKVSIHRRPPTNPQVDTINENVPQGVHELPEDIQDYLKRNNYDSL